MDCGQDTPTDDAPIRPVSTLKSHFESIASNRTTGLDGSNLNHKTNLSKTGPSNQHVQHGHSSFLGVSTLKTHNDGENLRQQDTPATPKAANNTSRIKPAPGPKPRGDILSAHRSAEDCRPEASGLSQNTFVGPDHLEQTPSTAEPWGKQPNVVASSSGALIPPGTRHIVVAGGHGSHSAPKTPANEVERFLAAGTDYHKRQSGMTRPTSRERTIRSTSLLARGSPAEPPAPGAMVNQQAVMPTTPCSIGWPSPFSTPPSSDDGSKPLRRAQSGSNSIQQATDMSPCFSATQQNTVIQDQADRSHGSISHEKLVEGSRSRRLRDDRGQQLLLEDARPLTMSKIDQAAGSMPIRRKAPPPPPKRPLSSKVSHHVRSSTMHHQETVSETESNKLHSSDVPKTGRPQVDDAFPDISHSNRSPPYSQSSARMFQLNEEVRLIEVCARYVCTASHSLRIFDISTGEPLFSISQPDRDSRITAISFKAAKTAQDEGSFVWAGTESGRIHEIDIAARSATSITESIHERHEIVKIHRYQDKMWTIDDNGRLCIWNTDNSRPHTLQNRPSSLQINRGLTCSLIIQDTIWIGHGKNIYIYRPRPGDSSAHIVKGPLSQPQLGAITAATVIGNQRDHAFFAHADGKISLYSISQYNCLSVINISSYKITAMTGVGSLLWTACSNGDICVYDTSTVPWNTRKTWTGHRGHSVLALTMDLSSLWRSGTLQVVSSGSDQCLRIWDGALRNDWLDRYVTDHEHEFCSFRDVTTLVMTWNAGATTPSHLRDHHSDQRFFQSLIRNTSHPDLIVFGFQELIDLEDKKLTAKTLFKGSKKKDTAEQEHMSHQYRAWRDFLVTCTEEASAPSDPYRILGTANMVGLFSCVFIKSSQYTRVGNLDSGEVKRGMGGLHGNKGAIALRFMLDDSSICLVNCHLAAGQTQTGSRNTDIQNILESGIFQADDRSHGSSGSYCYGGDGSMALDHEICILNGDLNYRIDTMGRETVLKALASNNIGKLLERDQLLVSRRRSPAFVLRAFHEAPIRFAPTYKYNVGTDTYDTSEKRRAPAWCDRVLYRGSEKCRQLTYLRHDLRVSDHRPVSAQFNLKVKSIQRSKETRLRERGLEAYRQERDMLSEITKIQYLRDVLGVPWMEARTLI